MIPDHVCDTCGPLCQGGCRDYTTHEGQPRHGCADERACMAAYRARRSPSPSPERNTQ